MKKVLAILALAIFIGGISAPVIAANNNVATAITLNEDDPKKKEKKETKKSDAKAGKDCQSAEGKPCCTKKCGDKGKK